MDKTIVSYRNLWEKNMVYYEKQETLIYNVKNYGNIPKFLNKLIA